MSQENVEIVRGGYEAFAGGDIEGVLEIMDPEVEWAPALAPLLGVEPVRGKDALRKFLTEDLASGFEDFEARAESIEDLGNAVLVHTNFAARGRASGVPVSLEAFSLIVLRDGKTISYRDYETKAEALEAAGRVD
jgi:ketosteroid isomerase-like protein